MKKWLLISSLLVVSPIFSMSRALRRGASLARRPIARRSSTAPSQVSNGALVATGMLGIGLVGFGVPKAVRKGLDEYIFYSDRKLLASLKNYPPLLLAFIAAVNKSSVKVIQQLLDEDGTLVNATDLFGNSALTVAVIRGDAEIVKALLDRGADVQEDSTPLIVALLQYNKTILKMLIEEGANIEEIRYKNFGKLEYPVKPPSDWMHKWSYRNYKIREQMHEMLSETIRGYGNCNSLSSSVNRFLMGRACGKAYGRGAKSPYTPLTVAVEHSTPEIVEMLLDNGANIKADYLLSVAVNRKNTGILKVLLSKGADIKTNSFLLVRTVKPGYGEIARILLENGANPNVPDKDGITPLMLASRCRGQSARKDGSYFDEEHYLEMVDLLSEHGADVNTRDKAGMTPLMRASRRGHKKMVEALLGHGADIEAIDNNGLTAWLWALKNGHTKIANMLRSLDIEWDTSVTELT